MKIAHEITHENFKKYILKEYPKLKNKKKRGGFCAGSFNAAKIKKTNYYQMSTSKSEIYCQICDRTSDLKLCKGWGSFSLNFGWRLWFN